MKETKHLFLEGPIQTGKSTLIQMLLAEHLPDHEYRPELIAGFTSQRLTLHSSGLKSSTVAFRIAPAMSPLTEPFDKKMLGNNPANSGIFHYIDADGNRHKYPQVFDALANRLSATYRGNISDPPRVILLDEIGGAELLNSSFREVLHEILSGSISCIGVIKLEENVARMIAAASYDMSILDLNRQLRDIIMKNNGSILRFRRGDESVVNLVSDFISEIRQR